MVLSRELEILSGLDHPHIARMFDVYEDRRCVHMVLEMCEGGDLVDVIQSSTQGLREADAFRLTGQLLWAVSYLHSKCIAHRDVKLDNLLLKEKVGDVALAQVKLIDFGMSKRFDSYNRLRTVGGTALYAAPEIMSGVNPGHRDAYYTEKVDVWSCGVSCYVLLTRRFPFDGPSDASILENASRAKVRSLTSCAVMGVPHARARMRVQVCMSVCSRIGVCVQPQSGERLGFCAGYVGSGVGDGHTES